MQRLAKFYRWFLLMMALVLLVQSPALAETSAKSQSPEVIQLTVNDAIGPATADYIERSLAKARRAELVVLRLDTPGGLSSSMRDIIKRLDTPGGLSSSMRDIIKHIAASSVPVATFVAPSGARAGTYILFASPVAAMAPGTNLGAATPVQIGGISLPKPSQDPSEESSKSSQPQDAAKRKAVNDAVAYIRGLAELHGRNVDWAEKAVREAASLPAQEALA